MKLHYIMIYNIIVMGSVMVFAGDPKLPLKERKSFGWQRVVEYTGVVTEIDKDAVMIDGKDANWGRNGTYKFFAVDLYKAGEVPESASAHACYRWQDVKVGDTILVKVLKDEESSVQTPYVIDICIRRRPNGKLPEGQKPKEDKLRWKKDSLLNDIDNGKDVEDEAIWDLFRPIFDPATGRLDRPGGLPGEYQKKLDVIREKLDADTKRLKAPSPDKK